MTTSAGRWAAATASVRGASHERDGKPNQDAVRVVQASGSTPGLVAAVCDGHGGDRYVRSDVGSRLGVEVACAVGRRALQDLGPSATASTIEAHLSGVVAESIIAQWRERVLDDLKQRAFTDDERARAGAPLEGDPHISYGATLLLAIMAPSWVGVVQIGDGDVTVVRQAHAESPVPTDDRLIGGETTSLCLPTAATDARVCVLDEPLPEMLILTTDGYANSFASPTWRTDAGLDLRNHVRRIGLEAVEKRLPSWLADSATAGGDDVSMALIQRVDVAAPADPTITGPAGAIPRPAAAGSSRQRSDWLVPVALAVTAAVAGIGIGWALGPSNESTGAAVTTVAATSTLPESTTSTTSSSTTPTTAIAADTTAPSSPPPPAISDDPNDKIVLLVGGSDGVVLEFNPNDPTTANPKLVRWGAVDAASPNQLPIDWEFADGVLSWKKDTTHPAVAVVATGGFVWAVSDDCTTLKSYDLGDGENELKSFTITGSGDGKTIPACARLAAQEAAKAAGRAAPPPTGTDETDTRG